MLFPEINTDAHHPTWTGDVGALERMKPWEVVTDPIQRRDASFGIVVVEVPPIVTRSGARELLATIGDAVDDSRTRAVVLAFGVEAWQVPGLDSFFASLNVLKRSKPVVAHVSCAFGGGLLAALCSTAIVAQPDAQIGLLETEYPFIESDDRDGLPDTIQFDVILDEMLFELRPALSNEAATKLHGRLTGKQAAALGVVDAISPDIATTAAVVLRYLEER